MRAALLLASVLATGCGAAQASDWRPAQLSDVAGKGSPGDYAHRLARPGGYLSITGDFDGDGSEDRAELSVNQGENRFGLFVHLGNSESILLDQKPLKHLSAMGISIYPAGIHPTWCGRWNEIKRARGKREQPCPVPAIEMKSAGIDFFTFESASRTYYWKDGAFASEWMSD